MGPLQSMSDSVLYLPRLPKKAALSECLKVLCDQDHTLSDYRETDHFNLPIQESEYTSQGRLSFQK